jgi:hypothetical protein
MTVQKVPKNLLCLIRAAHTGLAKRHQAPPGHWPQLHDDHWYTQLESASAAIAASAMVIRQSVVCCWGAAGFVLASNPQAHLES